MMAYRVFKRKIYDKLLHKRRSDTRSKTYRQVDNRRGIRENEYSSYLLIDFNRASVTVKALFEDLMDLDFIFLQLQTIYNVVLERRKRFWIDYRWILQN